VVGTAPPPADELVEVADKSVVPADGFVVLSDELVVGAEELAVVDLSDVDVASNASLAPNAASGQKMGASPSIGITKTLKAFKFLFWELRSGQKTKNLNH
jgi:hypothetical protein